MFHVVYYNLHYIFCVLFRFVGEVVLALADVKMIVQIPSAMYF
jgi:hypothetical protein